MKSSEVDKSSTVDAQKKFLNNNKVFFRLIILSVIITIVTYNYILVAPSTQQISQCVTRDLSIDQSQSFHDLMRSFPWQQYETAVDANNIKSIQNYTEKLLTTVLVPFTIKEPIAPVNSSCQAPSILEPEKIGKCSRLQYPRKVGVILNFGYDVDALELHLHELDSVVDKFFLMEGLKIHNRYFNTKPLIWDMIKLTNRFSQFRDKIVHFVLDDSDYATKETLGISIPEVWDRENLQKKIRIQKFLEWNTATKYFGPQDIIGVGDTDEIPNRNVVNFLKSCELQTEIVRVGTWFLFPFIDTIFASDYPIPGHPYTFNTPVYQTVTALTSSLTKNPLGEWDSKEGSILGGIHFSKYPYLPFQYIKLLTGTESETRELKQIINIGKTYTSEKHDNSKNLDQLVTQMWLEKWNELTNRIKSVSWFRTTYGDYEANSIMKLPWFYECNPDRYSSLHRERDQRIA